MADEEPIREVESLYDAFRDDLETELKGLPRIAEAMKRRPGERLEFGLTPEESSHLNKSVLWLLTTYVGSLAREIDRLHAELDEQADAGQDLDSEH